jgi:hypothetical protein
MNDVGDDAKLSKWEPAGWVKTKEDALEYLKIAFAERASGEITERELLRDIANVSRSEGFAALIHGMDCAVAAKTLADMLSADKAESPAAPPTGTVGNTA